MSSVTRSGSSQTASFLSFLLVTFSTQVAKSLLAKLPAVLAIFNKIEFEIFLENKIEIPTRFRDR